MKHLGDLMTQTSTQLVVPNKALPAFKEISSLPDDFAKFDRPQQGKFNKMKYCMQKSTLINGPILAVGSISGHNALIEAGILGEAALYFSTGSFLIGTGGIVATILGMASFVIGDRYFTPFKSTKKFIEMREKAKAKAIQPFDAWDAVFEKNTLPATENNKKLES